MRFARTRPRATIVTLVSMSALVLSTLAATGTAVAGSDQVPPTVTVSVPGVNATVSGSITVSGSASDDVGIMKVKFRVDRRGDYRTASGTTQWSGPVDTTTFSNGPHVLSVRAVDTSGNGTTLAVSFTIDNSGSVPPSPSPSPSPSPTPSPSPSPSPSPTPSPSPSPTTGSTDLRVGIGIASNDLASELAAAEAAIGARFVGIRRNASSAYPLFLDSGVVSAGDVVYRNINIENGNRPMFGGWAGVAAGNADAYIRAGYRAWLDSGILSPTGPKLILSIHHEQKVSSASQCGVGCNGTAADYVAMFRRWVDIADQMGVRDMILFAFVPSVKQYAEANDPTWGVNVMDPGARYVDVYGADAYVYADGASLTYPTPQSQGIDLVGRYAADRGRLALLGEFSVRADTPAGAAYLGECLRIWKAQDNWLAIFTDTANMTPMLLPVWRSTVNDPAFAFKGEFVWPR